jgi:hypothetical protein
MVPDAKDDARTSRPRAKAQGSKKISANENHPWPKL